ncbi:TPA: ead/Ea22-like family protein [Escherichia coli]|nr:ead/Ea22-like family protein [Escherichia coli]HAO1234018.1 ead/Ea22-like family protein [Escherichia coli]HCO2037811.1 ead/Ea22-like family protein [Escherichia coli]
MSKINYQALREAAEKATPDEWVAFISTDTGTYAVHTPGDERCEDVIKWTGFDGQKNAENNARYVAAFNPKVALELLGEIKRLEDTNIDAMCRIAELETNLAALAAENELARKAVQAFCDVVGDNTEVIAEVVGRDGVLVILEAMKATGNMPATDAFLAEVRAKAFDDLCAAFVKHASVSGLDDGDCVTVKEATDALLHCAEQLHKGVHS